MTTQFNSGCPSIKVVKATLSSNGGVEIQDYISVTETGKSECLPVLVDQEDRPRKRQKVIVSFDDDQPEVRKKESFFSMDRLFASLKKRRRYSAIQKQAEEALILPVMLGGRFSKTLYLPPPDARKKSRKVVKKVNRSRV